MYGIVYLYLSFIYLYVKINEYLKYEIYFEYFTVQYCHVKGIVPKPVEIQMYININISMILYTQNEWQMISIAFILEMKKIICTS